MAVRIVTDSTCDLPSALVQAHGITVVPLTVFFGDEARLDGVEISAGEFYDRLRASSELPRTSQPSVELFRETYERVAADGDETRGLAEVAGDLRDETVRRNAGRDLGENAGLVLHQHRDGDLVEAIRASIAVPGIFTPARRGDDLLVDGGLVNPVPVSVCRTMGAERIIAVDLNYGRVKDTRARNSTVKEKSALASQRPNFDAGQIFEWLERNTKQFDIELPNPLKSWMERHALPNVFDVLGNTLGIIGSRIAATSLEFGFVALLYGRR